MQVYPNRGLVGWAQVPRAGSVERFQPGHSGLVRFARSLPLFCLFCTLGVVGLAGCASPSAPRVVPAPTSTAPPQAPPTTAKWKPRVGRGNEVVSVLRRNEACGLLQRAEVEEAFSTKLDPVPTYERALFSNGRFSGCSYSVKGKDAALVSWKVQSWPFEVDRITDASMNQNGEFPKAVRRTVAGKPAAVQDFSTVATDGDESYRGMLLTVDFDTYSVLLTVDLGGKKNDLVALEKLGEQLVKRVTALTPNPDPVIATSAYEMADQALCDLVRDDSVFAWKPDSKPGTSGRLECDISIRVGVESEIRVTKAATELQIGRVVEYGDVSGELVPLGSGQRRAHVVIGGNETFPELAAWVAVQDDRSIMFRVLNLKDSPEHRRTVLGELEHIVNELEALRPPR
jgi:hypothetical protein